MIQKTKINMEIEALKKIKPKLIDLTKTSVAEGVEYGTNFCKVDNEIKLEIVKGEKGKIKLVPYCREGKFIGSFHTHPWDAEKIKFIEWFKPIFKEKTTEIVRDTFVLKPSANDIVLAIYNNSDIACIGSSKEPDSKDVIIKCFTFDKTHEKYHEINNKIKETSLRDIERAKKELEKIGVEAKKNFREFTKPFIL